LRREEIDWAGLRAAAVAIGIRCHVSDRAVRKGSDVLSEVSAEDSRETRIGLSAAARKAAETFAKMHGTKVIKHAQAHRHMTASSSVLHSWDDNGNQIPFTLNVLNINSLSIDNAD
jgi:hypothetical protein